jgi:competence protein ComEC
MLVHRSQVLFWGSLGFVVGITMVFVAQPLQLLLCIVLAFQISLLVFLNMSRAKERCSSKVREDVYLWSSISMIFSICMAVGVLYCDHRLHEHDRYTRSGEVVQIKGIIARQPVRSERFQNFEVRDIASDLRVLVRGPKYEDVSLGDEINLTCELEAPEAFDGFNYPKYLQMRGVDYLCKDATFAITAEGDGFLATLADFRQSVELDLNRLIRSPEAGLASGLLFGGDDRLSQEMQDAFARTGMSHIVAVSGYNVSVIIMVITIIGIYMGLWRKQAAIVSIIAIVLFVAMIGFPSSGVRAAVMGMIVLSALVYGRAAHALGAVIFASASMLLWNPLQVAYDVGFQLSFGAVVGIMAFVPLFEKIFVRRGRPMFIIEILFVTVSAQLFVVPIIVYHFGTFSQVSLATNLLVLPVLPFTMFFVFVTAVLSQVWVGIASVFAMISQALLTYEIAVIQYFASKSWSTIEIEAFSWALAMLYYGVLLFIVGYFVRRDYYNR